MEMSLTSNGLEKAEEEQEDGKNVYLFKGRLLGVLLFHHYCD